MRIAVVTLSRPMLDPHPPAVAVVPAAAEFGIERFEGFGIDLTDLHGAEHRSNVLADIALVSAPGVSSDIQEGEIPLQKLIDGGRGPGVSLLVDLVEQAS